MKEFRTLKVLDRFHTVFAALGVDYPVMRVLVRTKLTMDGRRVPTVFSQSSPTKQTQKTDSNQFIKSLWFYALIGMITVPFLFVGSNYLFQMSFVFGMLMFIVMMSMVSDFSAVLLDIRDRSIIGTKPVGRRTAAMAKMVHIAIYMFFLTGSIAVGPLLFALYLHGLGFFLLFVLELVLMNALILTATAFVYLAVLKFFDGEKLKDLINGIQIALSVGIAVSYQLVGRSFELFRFHFVFQPKWWQALVPPVWFGAPFEWLIRGAQEPAVIVLSCLAFLVPILALLLYIRLMPVFENSLSKLASNSSHGRKKPTSFLRVISRWVSRGGEERAFFRFAYRMLGNEREFKLKVYPSLGLSLVFPIIFTSNQWMNEGLASLASSKWYLSIYFCGMMVPTVIMMLKHSGNYKGAWIYAVAPVPSTRPILKGTIKAALVRLFMPLYAVQSALFLFIFGTKIISDLIVCGLCMLLYIVICTRVFSKSPPFSEPFGAVRKQEQLLALPLMLVVGIFVAIHWASMYVSGGLYLYMFLLVILNFFAWRMSFRADSLHHMSKMGPFIEHSLNEK